MAQVPWAMGEQGEISDRPQAGPIGVGGSEATSHPAATELEARSPFALHRQRVVEVLHRYEHYECTIPSGKCPKLTLSEERADAVLATAVDLDSEDTLNAVAVAIQPTASNHHVRCPVWVVESPLATCTCHQKAAVYDRARRALAALRDLAGGEQS